MKKKKVNPIISKYYSELGKKSAKKRHENLIKKGRVSRARDGK